MSILTLVHTASPQSRANGFNSRDLIALTCWMQRADAHGYRRVLLEGGSGTGRPEESGYVLIYSPGHEWANWGIARGEHGIVIWHCGSGADLGRFETMLEALDTLPPVRWAKPLHKRVKPTPNIPRFTLVHSA